MSDIQWIDVQRENGSGRGPGPRHATECATDRPLSTSVLGRGVDLTQESACDISRIVGSSSFVDVERGAFVSEELEMTPEELSVYGVDMDADGDAEFSDDEGEAV